MVARSRVAPARLSNQGRAKAFLAGAAVSVITAFYLGQAYHGNPGYQAGGGFPLHYAVIMVWFGYGIANALAADMEPRLGGENGSAPRVRRKYLAVGALVGLVFSLFGNYVADYPRKLFRVSPVYDKYTIPLAIVLYAAIFGFVVFEVNRLFGIA
jgi:hypothetical protein